MAPPSFPASLSPLDDGGKAIIIDEQLATSLGHSDAQPSMGPEYTSLRIITSPYDYDVPHRHWQVVKRIAKAHFGVNLPDPLEPQDKEILSLAHTTAVTTIRDWYLEASKDVMTHFYKRGLSRVSAAAHLYALDYRLWKQGKSVANPLSPQPNCSEAT